jgi:hypothetical protein
VEADAEERVRRRKISEGMTKYWETRKGVKTAEEKIREKFAEDGLGRAALSGGLYGLPTGIVTGAMLQAADTSNLPLPRKLMHNPLARFALGVAPAVAAGATAGAGMHTLEGALRRRAQEKTRGKNDETTKTAGVSAGFKTTGRDNRTPFVGKTQFPTEGSKGVAGKLLGQSQSRTEVGPLPSFGALSKENVSTVQSKAVKQLSPVGSLPKLGAAMSFVNDPLIQYFSTQPGQEEFRKYAEKMKDNEAETPKGKSVAEKQSENPDPSADAVTRSAGQTDEKLKELFANYPTEKAVIS